MTETGSIPPFTVKIYKFQWTTNRPLIVGVDDYLFNFGEFSTPRNNTTFGYMVQPAEPPLPQLIPL